MMNRTRIALLSAALAAFLLPAAAQNSTSAPNNSAPASSGSAPAPDSQESRGTVNGRIENQQDRIAHGVASGQLTAGEASQLESKEKAITQEERDMRKQDNGHLTKADQAILLKQQRQLSRQIYKDKHNSDVQNTHPKGEIGKREENQQDRIAQGINNGQLTSGEASQLEGKEAAINHEIAADKKANGGKLTAAERAQVNRQQNRLSRQIYKDRHNGRRQ